MAGTFRLNVNQTRKGTRIEWADGTRRSRKIGVETLFVGCHDVASKRWRDLVQPEYRNQYADAYIEDVKKHYGELTPSAANRLMGRQGLVMAKPPRRITDYHGLSAVAKQVYGETLPSIRLWMHWKAASGRRYVIGGVPDGVAPDYCYEFKTVTGSKDRVRENLRIARRQGQLYAHIFERPKVRVQIARFALPGGRFPFSATDLPPTAESKVVEDQANPQQVASILAEMDARLGAGV